MSGLYGNWLVNGSIVLATIGVVSLCVILHYEGLLLASRRLPRLHTPARFKVVLVIAAVLGLHVVEIWVFGLIEWLLLDMPGTGSVSGVLHPHLFDMIYLSAITFTTVGYGDLTPQGPLRFLYGTEALTGFVMITWSASFTYLEMARFWHRP